MHIYILKRKKIKRKNLKRKSENSFSNLARH